MWGSRRQDVNASRAVRTTHENRPIVNPLLSLRRFRRLLHDDIERVQEAEDDGKEIYRQGRDVDSGAVSDEIGRAHV